MFKKTITFFLLLAICSTPMLAAQSETAPADEEKIYFAVLVDGNKIGHAAMTRLQQDDRVTHTTQMSMTMNRMGTDVGISMSIKTVETSDGKPLSFESSMNAGGFGQQTTGRVNEDGNFVAEITSMGRTEEKIIPLPEDALMDEGIALYVKQHDFEEGDTFTVKYFDPSMLQVVPMHNKLGPIEQIDLFGKVIDARKIYSTIQAPTGSITTENHVVGDDMMPVKVVTAMMGMKLELISCTKEFALSPNDTLDFMNKMLIKSPTRLTNLGDKTRAVYTIESLKKGDLWIPAGPGQSVMQKANGSLIVEVTKATPAGGTFPYTGDDETLLAALESSRYVQSEDETIKQLAQQATKDCETTAQAVKKIERFVHGYITAKDLSVGYASAAEVAQSKQGDCTEHAVLTTAMCRAVGIPSRVVTGLLYVDGLFGSEQVFGGHAWSEAYVNGQWVGLDATRKASRGCSVGRIILGRGDGEPGDFLNIQNTLGYFRITAAQLE
ncbi:putative protein involved in cytokinesis, contains TGc (transglutaminase/protease-like) domain [Anaerohalosphaera lusitana]|uniref:Transglutaminase-like domain-containing protein n=1 Tax=Anaerohalosphaera lusitana TaxID=1936003 RepID=A0A1U9NIC9_9BACT|nr:transglutaminase-like domain-containing protein [Anaerohalosphaera lusitana]AQT67683.1 putative protein involved in cytokinesis, contains TGc (transglutaminase/protease-like) domain [Anaerohalosphaera lusitana]